MTLPPRCHPDRIEAMAANVAAGRLPYHGDDGSIIPFPRPPKGAVKVSGHFDLFTPGLRFHGPRWGWWVHQNTEDVRVTPEHRIRRSPKERFLANVKQHASGCWEWLAGEKITIRGQSLTIRRAAVLLFGGNQRHPGCEVRCVNPHH